MGIYAVARRAVFLDRDGVINRALIRAGRPHPPACVADIELLPGVHAALARLRTAGFRLIVVTNQPDVARGTLTREAVESIHAALAARGLPIDDWRVCYHDDRDRCDCRKPRPGLLFAAAQEYQLDLAASFMIGDRWRDIEAGRRAGCTTIWVDYGYAEAAPDRPDRCVKSLSEAADWILSREA